MDEALSHKNGGLKEKCMDHIKHKTFSYSEQMSMQMVQCLPKTYY